MKKKAAAASRKKPINWEAVCEENRQQCNKLTDAERRRFRDHALRLIYSADAETPTRSR